MLYDVWTTTSTRKQKSINELEPGEVIIPIQWRRYGTALTKRGADRLKRKAEKNGLQARIEGI